MVKKYRCINALGIPELTEGEVYTGVPMGLSDLVRLDRPKGEFFKDRFEDQGEIVAVFTASKNRECDWPDYPRGCTCSASKNPPCTYCESGGWCKKHDEYRHDCGCKWDEIEEY